MSEKKSFPAQAAEHRAANIHAAKKILQDPNLQAGGLMERWARLVLGTESVPPTWLVPRAADKPKPERDDSRTGRLFLK